jgi:hypothetical protein
MGDVVQFNQRLVEEKQVLAWSSDAGAKITVPESMTIICKDCNGSGLYGTRGQHFYCHGTGHFVKRPNQPTVAETVTLSATKLYEAFQKAKDKLIDRPMIQINHINFKMAPLNGKNPNAIYVTFKEKGSPNLYLGKITEGVFYPTSNCTKEHIESIKGIVEDPYKAVTAYGLRTGVCACCGRMLTNPESIARGIGPICAGNFFGG